MTSCTVFIRRLMPLPQFGYRQPSVLLFSCLLLLKVSLVDAQELNCQVSLQADPQIDRLPEERLLRGMEKGFAGFFNQNKWTNENFETKERIVCNLIVTLKENPSPNLYKAHAQLLAVRPVYSTDYQSVIINYVDEGFDFTYVEGQPLQNTTDFFSSNLEAMLTFYAYLFVGLDFDTFSPLGGTPYFEKARTVANLAQQTNDKNWTSFGSTRNRYWLIENLLRKDFEGLRTACYAYHREGMDIFLDQGETARKNIYEQLEKIEKLARRSRNAILLTVFLDAKYQEIIQIFSKGDRDLAQRTCALISKMDPGRIESYKKIIAP